MYSVERYETTVAGLKVFALGGHVIPGKLVNAVELEITTDPPSGSVLIYNRASPLPVQFDGPKAQAWVEFGGSFELGAQMIRGTKSMTFHVKAQRCTDLATAIYGPASA